MESKIENISTITAEQLWENGWEKTNDPIIPAKKCLVDKTDENYDLEEGCIEMVLHRYNNCNMMFALGLPDGSLVNINPASIDDLNTFERLILSYEPPY